MPKQRNPWGRPYAGADQAQAADPTPEPEVASERPVEEVSPKKKPGRPKKTKDE